MRSVRALAAAALLLLPACHVASAAEPKQGGILKFYHRDSPGSASIHEGATYSVNIPFMPVYNNSSFIISTSPRTASNRSSLNSPRAGPGAATARP